MALRAIIYKEAYSLIGNLKLMLALCFIVLFMSFFQRFNAKYTINLYLPLISLAIAWSISAYSFLEEKSGNILDTILSGPCNIFALWFAKTIVLSAFSLAMSFFAFFVLINVLSASMFKTHMVIVVWPIWLFALVGLYGYVLLTSLNRITAFIAVSFLSMTAVIVFLSFDILVNIIVSVGLVSISFILAKSLQKERVILGMQK